MNDWLGEGVGGGMEFFQEINSEENANEKSLLRLWRESLEEILPFGDYPCENCRISSAFWQWET